MVAVGGRSPSERGPPLQQGLDIGVAAKVVHEETD